jgi:hypothetical protein
LIVATLAVVLLRDGAPPGGATPGAETPTDNAGASEVASGGTSVTPFNVASPIDNVASRAAGLRVAEFEVSRPNDKPRVQSASADLTVGNGTTLPSLRLGELLNESLFRETEPRIEPPTPRRE